jgi:hypothetical protein
MPSRTTIPSNAHAKTRKTMDNLLLMDEFPV